MTDAAINSISLVVIAFFSMTGAIVTGVLSYRSTMQSRANGLAVAAVAETVVGIKAQTDGLTSALVKKTEEKATADVDAARLAGIEEQRLAGERTAATLEAGRRAGMEAAVSQALPSAPVLPRKGGDPVPVTDEAARRVAEATEKMANVAEQTLEKKL